MGPIKADCLSLAATGIYECWFRSIATALSIPFAIKSSLAPSVHCSLHCRGACSLHDANTQSKQEDCLCEHEYIFLHISDSPALLTKFTDFTSASTLRPADTFPTTTLDQSICPPGSSSGPLPWYEPWVRQQLNASRPQILSVLLVEDDKDPNRWNAFASCWKEVEAYTATNTLISIDTIITHLLQSNNLRLTSKSESILLAKQLIFSIIGWQTMLYQTDPTCPLSQLAIRDAMTGHKGQAHMNLQQPHTASKKPLCDLLLMYGLLLPPRNMNTAETSEHKVAFNDMRSASPSTFNASLLTSIAGIDIRWVDSLACHLEFDPHSGTLFLFRYPSFCKANYCVEGDGTGYRSTIHMCGRPEVGIGMWATAREVNDMLFEVLTSYRLLFGQHKASRQWFRKQLPFAGTSYAKGDEVLMSLCGRKQPKIDDLGFALADRTSYDLQCDFPILRSRLAVLLQHLASKKPRTWGELWKDKRDSASWLTFWAVIIIGGAGILLAFIQVVLQIVQITQA